MLELIHKERLFKGNKLYITVTAGEYESNGIQFYSEDAGESWNVLTK